MPLQATSGAASYDAFGGGVAAVPQYIEDVFSTYLYTGNGSTQTITNGIDLSGKGGLVWTKIRNGTGSNRLVDTVRGGGNVLISNATNANVYDATIVPTFSSSGFDTGGGIDISSYNYASWTFREQPKFFDVVTYTGNGTNNRAISHSLGSTPGCVIVKRTDTASDIGWAVYHRGAAQNLALNLTDAQGNAFNADVKTPTSTTFTVSSYSDVNASGGTFVAYLFAHDAGGFGLTGTDNVISCGSYTGSSGSVNLGYEPQWLLVKQTNASNGWRIFDNMRGWTVGPTKSTGNAILLANTSGAETDGAGYWGTPTATGFDFDTGGGDYIYIAIRRGPMKVPTVGTSVFGMSARSGTGADATVTGGQTDDAVLIKNRGSAVASLFSSRLTGTGYLVTSATDAEVAAGTTILQANPWDVMDGVKVGTTSTITNASANTYINYLFKRAPSFFDEVCYTGTLATLNVSHNLGAVPQLIITKSRSATGNWTVQPLSDGTKRLRLQTTAAEASDAGPWDNTNPTSSIFTLGGDTGTNASGVTYVAYLFATCAGVSKVGSYTGNGSTQTIDCGFGADGARFVLIKRTDAAGDWHVYDTARGMTVLTDPYLFLNTTDAEVATLGSVTTVSTGFALNSTILAAINVSAASYIFLAIS